MDGEGRAGSRGGRRGKGYLWEAVASQVWKFALRKCKSFVETESSGSEQRELGGRERLGRLGLGGMWGRGKMEGWVEEARLQKGLEMSY